MTLAPRFWHIRCCLRDRVSGFLGGSGAAPRRQKPLFTGWAMADNKASDRRYRPRWNLGRGESPGKAPSEDAMYVLEARDLRKSFGEGEASVEALRGVNL